MRIPVNSSMDLSELTIVTIATGQYLAMVNKQIVDFARKRELGNAQKGTNPIWVILTNVHNPVELFDWPESLEIRFAKVENYGWPEVTLFRYKEILRNEHLFSTNYLVWLDSDMKILALPKFSEVETASIYFAPHPSFNFNISFSASNFLAVAKMFLGRVIAGHLSGLRVGDWESNKQSMSFVPPRLRKPYVHGAFWGGSKSEVLEMCRTLSGRTEIDYARGIVAQWHDESHLNWFFCVEGGRLLIKSASYWKSNQSLLLDNAFVESLDKSLGLDGMWAD